MSQNQDASELPPLFDLSVISDDVRGHDGVTTHVYRNAGSEPPFDPADYLPPHLRRDHFAWYSVAEFFTREEVLSLVDFFIDVEGCRSAKLQRVEPHEWTIAYEPHDFVPYGGSRINWDFSLPPCAPVPARGLADLTRAETGPFVDRPEFRTAPESVVVDGKLVDGPAAEPDAWEFQDGVWTSRGEPRSEGRSPQRGAEAG